MSTTISSRNWFNPARIIVIVVVIALAAAAVFTYWPQTLDTASLSSESNLPVSDTWPTNSWPITSPESMGLVSGKLGEVLNAVKENEIPIHSWMIVRNGFVVLDSYFYPYDGTTLHDIASATKSITTTLIGIAVDHGYLSMDDTMLSFFPDRTVENNNELKQQITVRDLVTMTSGLHCDDKGGDEWTQAEMRASDDWIQFVLDLEAIHEPGTVWAYCSPGSYMLSAILTQATGMSALDFAQQNLFTPLGIEEVYWPADSQGVTWGWGDLAMYPKDMAKIGLLWLNLGEWDGQQVVSRSWVEEAITPFIRTDRGQDYGYGLWLNTGGDIFSYMASGRNGQEIAVAPQLGLVLVKTGGGYEPAVLDRYLETTIGDLMNGIPENAAGRAQLQTAIEAMVVAPEANPIPELPTTAAMISGKSFLLEGNGLFESAIKLTFLENGEAMLEVTVQNETKPRISMVGLDGLYRASVSGKPALARGEWWDESTFRIEYNEGPGLNLLTLIMKFEGDQVEVKLTGVGTFVGTVQQ